MRSACRALVEAAGIQSRVSFVGLIQNQAKAAALSSADIFVLPSFSEGFSSSVLEAMSYRCPVCITPGCNFPEVERSGAGLIVEADQPDTEKGLRQLMEMSDQERKAMGESAHRLVTGTYNWSEISDQMISLYNWLQNGGSAPAFIDQ